MSANCFYAHERPEECGSPFIPQTQNWHQIDFVVRAVELLHFYFIFFRPDVYCVLLMPRMSLTLFGLLFRWHHVRHVTVYIQ